MALHDRTAYGQSHADPLGFSSEECFKYSLQPGKGQVPVPDLSSIFFESGFPLIKLKEYT